MRQKMPVVELDLAAASGWNRVVAILGSLALVVSLTWWFAAPAELPQAARLALLTLALGAIAIAWSARQCKPCRLRWDGEQWFVGPAAADASVMTPGQVEVLVDLQFAMLLRFRAVGGGPLAVRWLALDCRTQREHWHLLRCAAHRRTGGEARAAGALHLETRE